MLLLSEISVVYHKLLEGQDTKELLDNTKKSAVFLATNTDPEKAYLRFKSSSFDVTSKFSPQLA